MKKIFILILSVFAINTAFAQSFGTTAEIINSDCRIQFNNTNGVKIFELIGENLTWWRQSNNSIVIRDKVTQVTVASNYSGTPAFAALDDSLDAWILACKDCCEGGGGGGSSEGLNTIQFSDGNGGFFGVDTTYINEDEDTVKEYIGIGEGYLSLKAGINNATIGIASFATGFVNTSNGASSASFGGNNTGNGMACLATGIGNIVNSFGGASFGTFSKVASADNENPMPEDTVLSVGNGSDPSNRSNALTLQRNGNLSIKGVYSSVAYENYTSGGNVTIPDNVALFLYNPSSTESSATITLPTNPIDGQITTIAFGGSVSSGTVVTTLSLSTSGGQTINVGTAAATGTVEQPLTFQFLSPLNKWYLISK